MFIILENKNKKVYTEKLNKVEVNNDSNDKINNPTHL